MCLCACGCLCMCVRVWIKRNEKRMLGYVHLQLPVVFVAIWEVIICAMFGVFAIAIAICRVTSKLKN